MCMGVRGIPGPNAASAIRTPAVSTLHNVVRNLDVDAFELVFGDQKKVCGQVIDEGGDYLLVIKRNRKDLDEDVELCFERPVDGQPYHYAEM